MGADTKIFDNLTKVLIQVLESTYSHCSWFMSWSLLVIRVVSTSRVCKRTHCLHWLNIVRRLLEDQHLQRYVDHDKSDLLV